MFGGGNDNAAVEPTDHQDLPAENTSADTPTNGLAPSDTVAAPAFSNTSSLAGDAPTPASSDPLATPTAATIPDSTSSGQNTPAAAAPADDILTDAPNDLIAIKQQALQQLSPLVGHLDQSPEERFRTTMMMIQASDNADLVKDAYAAAQQIPDEKSRAQALLDVVNEINYFTQHHDQQ